MVMVAYPTPVELIKIIIYIVSKDGGTLIQYRNIFSL